MKDPLLLTYAIREYQIPQKAPFLFDVSSRLQPISLRDQLFRAHGIVTRAVSDGLIRRGQDDPILVIGGGAAGLVATLAAMQRRIPVVLVERERPLATQGTSRRIICATEYDWPARHWSRKVYPANDEEFPLVLKSGDAPALLRSWASQLERWRKRHPKLLRLVTGKKFVDYQRLQESIAVKLDPEEPGLPLFKLVISAAGFGTEKTWLPEERKKLKYRGFAFWELDPFGEANVALPPDETPNVVICGGGDGALQDFLRITCGKSAGEIYELLPEPAREFIERRIAEAEDGALRRFLWSSPGALDHSVHLLLHEQHQAAVDELFAANALWKQVKGRLNSLIPPFIGKTQVRLAYSCDHFSSCYPLNRFLALLVSRYLETVLKRKDLLLPQTKVVEIYSVGHGCLDTSFDESGNPRKDLLGDPHYCHGKLHELKYAKAKCDNFMEAGKNPRELIDLSGGPFNVVIVRYGIDPHDPPLKHHAGALPMRQVIPYSDPW